MPPSTRSSSGFDRAFDQITSRFSSLDTVETSLAATPTLTAARARSRFAYIQPLWAECRDFHLQLQDEASESDLEDHVYFQEKQFATRELQYLRIVDVLSDAMETAAGPALVELPSDAATTPNNGPTNVTARTLTRMPRIELPRFAGSYRDWTTFHDYFSSLIINDSAFDDLQRLHYLKSCLDGDAAALLKNILVTAANFASSWELLKVRFASERSLVSQHIAQLFEIPDLTRESAVELRKMLNSVHEVVQSLKNLGRPLAEPADMLVQLMISRLDSQTRKAWELSLGTAQEFPSYAALTAFLETRIHALEALPAPPARASPASRAPRYPGTSTANAAQVHHGKVVFNKCPVCQEAHTIYACPQFAQKPVEGRLAAVKQKRLCNNCLSPGHLFKNCNSQINCRRCNLRHHSLLHKEPSPAGFRAVAQSSAPPSPGTEQNVSSHFSMSGPQAGIMLATARISVSNGSRSFVVRALLDQGSTHTFVTAALAKRLRCIPLACHASLSVLGGLSAGQAGCAVRLIVSPAHSTNPALSTDALVLSTLTSYTPRLPLLPGEWPHLRGLDYADPDPTSTSPIEIILGADLYGYVLREGLRQGTRDQPVAQNTIFGWILSGSSNPPLMPSLRGAHAHLINADQSLEANLRRFWENEEVARFPVLSAADAECERHFCDTHSRTPEGRYIVRIPFSHARPLPIGNSRSRADKLLLGLENRLAKKPEESALYTAFMREYEALGHMTAVTPAEVDPTQTLYLSHHPVLKLTSTTTKLRVVFNASAPTSTQVSINDMQHCGPKLQSDLPLLITRWRLHRFVYCADLAQMYRQILVHEEDRDLQRIRWRYDSQTPIQSYRLNTVTFGMSSAPFLAQRVLKQLAVDEGPFFPLAANILRDDFYVDDCLFGADDPALLRQSRDQLISLLGRGGFVLRKWASNSASLLTDLSDEDHGLAIDREVRSDDTLKLLGLVWSPARDCYRPSVRSHEFTAVTKRSVLSLIARLFDPLGWLSPVVITAKIFLQTLWLDKLPWDENVPPALRSIWSEYSAQLPMLNEIEIPRWVGCRRDSARCELHGFSDASTKACAAVIYLRVLSADGSCQVHLLQSKTRVAPVKQVSIPRLELNAAVLLAEMFPALSSLPEYAEFPRFCWTDSTIVLGWLSRESSSWRTYVANRISTIQSCLPSVGWRHISGLENPADVASRGLAPSELRTHPLWWTGPTWLRCDEAVWPSTFPPMPPECQTEAKATVLHQVATSASALQFVESCSTWTRIIRSLAWALRWAPRHARSRSADLTVSELETATVRLLLLLQREQFPAQLATLRSGTSQLAKSDHLSSLSPYLDSNGLLRVGGRLEQTLLTQDAKHPVILRSHRAVKLLVEYAHLFCCHGGVSLTLAVLRSRFWVLQAKKVIRSVLEKCVRCARLRIVEREQLMAALPAPRVLRPARPFVHCGVDYAGPFSVRIASGRGRKSHPAYLAIFVCFAVKAIHVEVVSDYSTPAFLAAFRRFCARRGKPSHLYSDRGTNFQGAARELTQAFRAVIADADLQARLVNDEIEWHFIPPASPHFGGLWEAGVKSVKTQLKRVLVAQTPTFEELTTLTAQIEACLNSRPLSPLVDDPESLDTLTPGHFLIGGPLVALPQPLLDDRVSSCTTRWQLVQQNLQRFWRGWSTDYVLAQQHRQKWRTASPSISVGQLVLLRSDALPPTKWNLGRVTSVKPGPDGLVRVVEVRTATSTYLRPLSKLALLPVCHDAEPTVPQVTPPL